MPSATPPNVDLPSGSSVQRDEDFVNLAAHELKNPLGALAIDAEFLARSLQDCAERVQRDKELAEVAKRMASSARRMSEQVSDLLALAIDDRSDSDSEVIDLNALVASVAQPFQSELAAVNGRIDVEPLPAIAGRSAGLRMLFQNLISNAIRYRHPDRPLTISIECRSYRIDGGRRLHSITVGDNGIGIPQSAQRQIFEPYSRASGDDDGLGLGLSICQRVVRRMGATIHVTSDGHSGSEFNILIHDRDPTPEHHGKPPWSGAPAKERRQSNYGQHSS